MDDQSSSCGASFPPLDLTASVDWWKGAAPAAWSSSAYPLQPGPVLPPQAQPEGRSPQAEYRGPPHCRPCTRWTKRLEANNMKYFYSSLISPPDAHFTWKCDYSCCFFAINIPSCMPCYNAGSISPSIFCLHITFFVFLLLFFIIIQLLLEDVPAQFSRYWKMGFSPCL